MGFRSNIKPFTHVQRNHFTMYKLSCIANINWFTTTYNAINSKWTNENKHSYDYRRRESVFFFLHLKRPEKLTHSHLFSSSFRSHFVCLFEWQFCFLVTLNCDRTAIQTLLPPKTHKMKTTNSWNFRKRNILFVWRQITIVQNQMVIITFSFLFEGKISKPKCQ